MQYYLIYDQQLLDTGLNQIHKNHPKGDYIVHASASDIDN